MELHPILECGDKPSEGLWYVISPTGGKGPESRVGQACVACNYETAGTDEILAIGGANPSSTFSDVYRLNWRTLQWTEIECSGFRSRYEHAAFIPASKPNLVYAFGGANKSGNLDCLQAFDRATGKWNVTSYEGLSPGPRTLHSGGYGGDKLYVFGGGHLGTDPVADLQLHIFDAMTKSWSQHDLEGETPSPRHGHVMTVVEETLYIHGGMAGTDFYEDLYAIGLANFKSSKLDSKGDVPCARAGHSTCAFHSKIFIFGGMCPQGALDDFISLDTATSTWTSIKFDCPPPVPRLDHSMLCTMLPVKKREATCTKEPEEQAVNGVSSCPNKSNGATAVNGKPGGPKIVPVDIWQGTVAGSDTVIQNLSTEEGSSGDGSVVECHPTPYRESTSVGSNGVTDQEYDYLPVCVIIGGMDTFGNLFNDILVTRVGGKA